MYYCSIVLLKSFSVPWSFCSIGLDYYFSFGIPRDFHRWASIGNCMVRYSTRCVYLPCTSLCSKSWAANTSGRAASFYLVATMPHARACDDAVDASQAPLPVLSHPILNLCFVNEAYGACSKTVALTASRAAFSHHTFVEHFLSGPFSPQYCYHPILIL